VERKSKLHANPARRTALRIAQSKRSNEPLEDRGKRRWTLRSLPGESITTARAELIASMRDGNSNGDPFQQIFG
jgi:hypothetical protein